jgi:hypothetical protein
MQIKDLFCSLLDVTASPRTAQQAKQAGQGRETKAMHVRSSKCISAVGHVILVGVQGFKQAL